MLQLGTSIVAMDPTTHLVGEPRVSAKLNSTAAGWSILAPKTAPKAPNYGSGKMLSSWATERVCSGRTACDV